MSLVIGQYKHKNLPDDGSSISISTICWPGTMSPRKRLFMSSFRLDFGTSGSSWESELYVLFLCQPVDNCLPSIEPSHSVGFSIIRIHDVLLRTILTYSTYSTYFLRWSAVRVVDVLHTYHMMSKPTYDTQKQIVLTLGLYWRRQKWHTSIRITSGMHRPCGRCRHPYLKR